MTGVAICFTVIVGLLIVWQFLSEKGRKNHILRGLLILALSIPPAILNTLSVLSRGENILDSPSILVHILLGSLFYIAVLTSIFFGIKMWASGRKSKKHKVSAYLAIAFFLIMFFVPFIIKRF